MLKLRKIKLTASTKDLAFSTNDVFTFTTTCVDYFGASEECISRILNNVKEFSLKTHHISFTFYSKGIDYKIERVDSN